MPEDQTQNQQEENVFTPDGELVISYRPYASMEKWIKYRFSAFSSVKALFTIGLVMLFFGFGGPQLILEQITNIMNSGASSSAIMAGAGQTPNPTDSFILPGLFLTFLGIYLIALARYLSHPTHISVSKAGICMEWHRWNYSNGLMMPWSKVERVDLAWPPDKTSPQDSIIRFKELSTAINGSNQPESYPIKLKLGSIATSEDRHKMLKAIEYWGADVPRDPQLIDVLTPAQDDSYTELWLQALSAPPKRERLTPISEGALLLDGKYSVVGQLGVGGQGTAYLARRVSDNAEVVLKEFILPVYVDVNVRRQALESMQHEAAMLKRLDSPQVVKLIEFFVEDHRGYLVLERIDGLSLRRIVEQEGRMSEERVRDLAAQMCSILQYLHSLSPPVVHRDFTPDNLILNKDGILKLVDFNVAQQTESTATGTVVGKHAYLPPEQFRGRPTPQSDIYAMGATLVYLLLGEDPEPITCSHPINVRDDVSPELDQIIARATALDTAKRYAIIEDLDKDLGPKDDKQQNNNQDAQDEESGHTIKLRESIRSEV
ncbi:MAG: serine/threonine protein kinase [Candidatus Melainabacteria bacterium]|nr:MAG: serine/threonine protein kinase [Candidatus Melainabacteria bacterium]